MIQTLPMGFLIGLCFDEKYSILLKIKVSKLEVTPTPSKKRGRKPGIAKSAASAKKTPGRKKAAPPSPSPSPKPESDLEEEKEVTNFDSFCFH